MKINFFKKYKIEILLIILFILFEFKLNQLYNYGIENNLIYLLNEKFKNVNLAIDEESRNFIRYIKIYLNIIFNY